ncbi:hypothetical protein L596_019584 [Steinernema carpocapsae]|uniref:F-box domain-containing protein n=1 Tax=Steinernema carpocapsae TaxID=34508 RepID=A0A4U5MR39_STECR|nr:hypothetical protein L596_019584 [Steinernema carpocapsae]
MQLFHVSLPGTVIDYILSFLSLNERLPLRRVCRQWKAAFDGNFTNVTSRELRITQKLKENCYYYKQMEAARLRSSMFFDMMRCVSQNQNPLLLNDMKSIFMDLEAFKGDTKHHPLSLDFDVIKFVSQFVEFNRLFITNIHFNGILLARFGELLSYLRVQELVLNNCDFSLVMPEEITSFMRSLYSGINSIDIRFGNGFEQINLSISSCTRYFQSLSELSMKPSIELDDDMKAEFYTKDIGQLLPLSQEVSKFKMSGMATSWDAVMELCTKWCQSDHPSTVVFFPYLHESHLDFLATSPVPGTFQISHRSEHFVAFQIQHYTRKQFSLCGRLEETRKKGRPKYKVSIQTKINLKLYRSPALKVVYKVNNIPVPCKNYYWCKENGGMFYDQGDLVHNVASPRFSLMVEVSKETTFAVVCACNYKENVTDEKEFVVCAGRKKHLNFDLSKSACKRVCLYGWVVTDDLKSLSPWLSIRPNPEFVNMCCTFIRFHY